MNVRFEVQAFRVHQHAVTQNVAFVQKCINCRWVKWFVLRFREKALVDG
jgi:hypothetical protein